MAAALVLAVAACSGDGVGATTTTGDGTTTSGPSTTAPGGPTTMPPGEQPIADGEWFAFVTVGEDETGAVTLGIDLAGLLSGEEAHRAAVEDGFISEGEDLPNDFYIDNDDQILELLHVADEASFGLISATDAAMRVSVDIEILVEVFEGTYTGDALYAAAGMPIPMDVTIVDGLVSGGDQVYLP